MEGRVYRTKANRPTYPGLPEGVQNQRFSFDCYFFVVNGVVENHEITAKGYAALKICRVKGSPGE
jgi:hypothetical protein